MKYSINISLIFSYFLLAICIKFRAAEAITKDKEASPNYKYETKYYELPIDHFAFTQNGTFLMKYLINDTWWNQDGGPIFFYTGNEGSIELFAENTGFMWELAPKFNALLLFAEHRYYGTSLPFGNDSLSKNPLKSGYLTSEQALADFADFLSFFKYHFKGASKSAIIAFGGSYGGMLSAWMRIKYPHIIQGAIAASAPVIQFPNLTPCNIFSKLVTTSFQKSSNECVQTIRKSWKLINDFGETQAGRFWISSNWRLCSQLNSTEDVQRLKDWLTNLYGNLAMVNYPYSANFLAPLPPYPINVFCSKMDNSNLSPKLLLKSLFKGLSVYFNYTGETKCLDTSEEASSSLSDVGWDYQSCTEMVMPMCSDGISDFFEPQQWNFTKFSEECFNKWNVTPRLWMTQIIYGGRNLYAASNIVFSNGLLDPWSGGGILSNISSSVLAVVISEGAHHLDLRHSNVNDPQSVIDAREFEMKQITKWIQQFKSP